MNEFFIILSIGMTAIALVSFLLAVSCRKKTEHAMDSIVNKLDQALGGSFVEADYDETMESAIAERLNRVIEIAGIQRNQAQEERDYIKALVSDISHQVRTPLSNIVLYAGLLQEEKVDDSTKKLADKIQNQSEKLDFFMKELVKSSCTEEEMIQVNPERVTVSDLVNEACQLVEIGALKKNIKIQYTEQNAVCFADKKWTVEAIGNVLDNAIKYSPGGSTVQIEEKVYESFVGLTIQDQGMGIAEKEQGLIFRRFYRSPKAVHTSGFGIGLYMVREVLSKQNGYIKVSTKEGEGTSFQLFFTRRG